MSIAALPLRRSRVAARQRQDFLKNWRGSGSGRFFKIHRGSGATAVDFLKIHRGSGSIFFENIEKVHEFDRILVFTSETS
jgi:hypothetical protein